MPFYEKNVNLLHTSHTKIFLVLFIVGFLLVCINISGFILPLRSQEIYRLYEGTTWQIDLSEQQVWDIAKNTSVDRKQYLINVNNAVDRGVVHYWG